MATIIDVAAYILREYGPMTTMKLQKTGLLLASGVIVSLWSSSF